MIKLGFARFLIRQYARLARSTNVAKRKNTCKLSGISTPNRAWPVHNRAIQSFLIKLIRRLASDCKLPKIDGRQFFSSKLGGRTLGAKGAVERPIVVYVANQRHSIRR